MGNLGASGTNTDMMSEMAKRMARTHNQVEQRVLLGTVMIKRLQMLVGLLWIRDHQIHCLALNAADLDPVTRTKHQK